MYRHILPPPTPPPAPALLAFLFWQNSQVFMSSLVFTTHQARLAAGNLFAFTEGGGVPRGLFSQHTPVHEFCIFKCVGVKVYTEEKNAYALLNKGIGR